MPNMKKDGHFVGRPLIFLLLSQDLWTFNRDGDRMLGVNTMPSLLGMPFPGCVCEIEKSISFSAVSEIFPTV